MTLLLCQLQQAGRGHAGGAMKLVLGGAGDCESTWYRLGYMHMKQNAGASAGFALLVHLVAAIFHSGGNSRWSVC